MLEKILTTLKNKTYGFYVGVASALLALVTLIIYCAMGSVFFSGWVVAGLVVGIVAFIAAALLRIDQLYILSYVCYMFALYHFCVLEIELRMDMIVDPATGPLALDGMFYAAVVFFILTVVTTIVASCLKQDKGCECCLEESEETEPATEA